MSHHSTSLNPKTSAPRPQLPYAHANPFLSLTDNAKVPSVKYQVITREGQEIVVGRVKIQTPGGGHAFVLRRFDTGAISLTTMFRAAFPSAPDDSEKTEASWVKANFDSSGTNGGVGRETLRLAGTWVRPDVAATIAPMYSLDHIISPLVSARPDPRQEYRRSTKTSSPQVNGNTSPTRATNPRIEVAVPSTPSPAAGPNPPKRRKEASPAVTSPTKESTESLPVPRRSMRPVSPGPIPSAPPQAIASASRTSRGKIAKTRATLKPVQAGKPSSRLTPVESDHAHIDDDDDVAEVPGPDMHDDIAEQKELIAKLKAERAEKECAAAATAAATAAASTDEASGSVSAVPLQQTEPQSSKRSREGDELLKFQFREPVVQKARKIKSNKRLSLDLEPQQKSAVWGALWFAAGLAAAATIPSLFM